MILFVSTGSKRLDAQGVAQRRPVIHRLTWWCLAKSKNAHSKVGGNHLEGITEEGESVWLEHYDWGAHCGELPHEICILFGLALASSRKALAQLLFRLIHLLVASPHRYFMEP